MFFLEVVLGDEAEDLLDGIKQLLRNFVCLIVKISCKDRTTFLMPTSVKAVVNCVIPTVLMYRLFVWRRA